ncbi:SLC13 family permease [Mesonia sp. HuA40]|uniref:SLC13 family permease n=1 Tax=Mesonia sp. HuA40 TaxID=2602761 RepID=UPI0011CA1BAE|nr:SLC13 family permease [Mesonia sp. HuA40]TXK73882.1 SLC13 family permease [Mesonia sp. HuA40]
MYLTITFIIIGIGIFLFVKDYFSIDTTSILIMSLFIVSGVLNPEEGFAGFNHPATITLGCMFVLSAAVFKSGIINGLSSKIVKIARVNYVLALIVFCLTAAVFSAFINDTAVVAMLIPMALMVSRETGIAPSRLLIPISFSALFGGTCTLIGTSTNILVSSYAQELGSTGFKMFEFSLAALGITAAGLIYIFIVAPLILPKRIKKSETLQHEAEDYMAEIEILPKNPDINKAIGKSFLISDLQVQILMIKRNHLRFYEFNEETILREGDVLKVLMNPSKTSKIRESKYYKFSGIGEISEDDSEKRIFEVMIPHGSSLSGKTLAKTKFRNNYYASVLAIRQRKETITKNVANVSLKEGDMLLIYTARHNIQALTRNKMLVALSEYEDRKINYKKAIPAILILMGVILAAAFNITSILISALVGSLLIVTTAILKPNEAYKAIEWKVIFMVAGVLSMGKALEKTGGSELISNFLFENLGGLPPQIMLSFIFLFTFLATNVLSSKATAVLMTPIVIEFAQILQVSEKPFLIAVMFACSLTFMTPVSYPTNTMVYAPGNYKFTDYLKIGTPLNLVVWIAASIIIPLFFPF